MYINAAARTQPEPSRAWDRPSSVNGPMEGSGLPIARTLQPVRMSQLILLCENREKRSLCFPHKLGQSNREKVCWIPNKILNNDVERYQPQSNETSYNHLNAESDSDNRVFSQHKVLRSKACEERGGA